MELRGGEPPDLADTILARLSAPRPAGVRIGARGAAAIILGVAVLARVRAFGNPIVQVDEQYYRLVGGRMLQGALPYVDIWDRKPIGLFLIYAATRLVPGDGVIAYQLLGLACVWATALILFALAWRIAPPSGALAAALLYVLALDLAGGEAGQAPIFYTLPVAGAVAIVVVARDRARGGDLRRPGMAAMGLFGLALQIKYSVVFEGAFAGLVLIGSSWRGGRRPAALAGDVALWIGCALLPTLAAAGYYAAIGHLSDWTFANIVSIAARRSEPADVQWRRIRIMIAMVAPLVAAIPLRRWLGARPATPAARADLALLDGWAAAALLGVILFGTWFNHYALPLFAPLAVTAAPLALRRSGQAVLLVLLCVAGVMGQHMLRHRALSRGDRATFAAIAAGARDHHGCIFVYDGPTALYDAVDSCLPTTHPFPGHLVDRNEIGATGIDQPTEVRRIMAARPDRVLTIEPARPNSNPASRAAIVPILAHDYVVLGRYPAGTARYVLYGLRGTAPRADR